MMTVRQSETLMKISRTLLEKKRSEFIVDIPEKFEDKD